MRISLQQQTLVILKPDTIRAPRTIRTQILLRLTDLGLFPVILDIRSSNPELVGEHYEEHREHFMFPAMIEFMTSGPMMLVVLEGNDAVAKVRNILGNRLAMMAAPNTLRNDFRAYAEPHVCSNLIHASDSPASAVREIGLWFPDLYR